MKLATGNMFSHHADLTLVTTNSYVRSRDHGLVMGRGAANQIKQRLTDAERIFGDIIWCKDPQGSSIYKRYGVITYGPWGIFQVKYHWGKPAVPDLISYSVQKLAEIAPQYGSISLNYPGVGNGGLSMDVVRPLIECLPDNVTVWTLL